MDTTVRMRQNHHGAIGPKPTPSDRKIQDSFARAVRLPHSIAERVKIDIAFDPINRAKRRAYDVARAFIPKPQLRIAPPAISFPNSFLATRSNQKGYPPEKKQAVIAWKYSTFAFGSLVVGVVFIGAWAGAHAEDAPPETTKSTLTIALPPAKAASHMVEVPASSSNGVTEPEFISPALIERARRRIRARAPVNRLVGSGRTLESPAAGAAAATGQDPRALQAKLPLPNPVIVRTIERIGYACGAVASAVAIAGDEPGTYKVTCTSGQSYQARPVHGRYHFRRW